MRANQIAPGLYHEMGLQEYLEIDAVSNSALRDIRVSPLHYIARTKIPRVATDRMLRGTAGHIAVFQRARFIDGGSGKRVVATPETNPDTGNAWRKSTKADKAFRDEHRDCLILSRDEYYTALRIGDAVRECSEARRLLMRGQAEVVGVWRDPESRVLCKARYDFLSIWITDDDVEMARDVELKTCASVEPRIFVREAARRGYHRQRAWYRRGLRALGYHVEESPIIAVEQDEPNDCCVYRVPEAELQAGDLDNQAALDLLLQCRERNEWPGKVPGGWAELDFEEHGCGWALGDDEITIGGENAFRADVPE